MNTEERQAEIKRLKEEHKEALSAPKMSEGNISPFQVGMMSERQWKKWSDNVQESFDVEYKIKLLNRTDRQIESDEREEQARKNKSRLSQINSRIELLSNFKGKNGKIRPKYKKEIERLSAEKESIAGELLPCL